MNDADMLAVTEEQLFAIIGRLHVENLVLRARLAELQQAAEQENNTREITRPRPVRQTGE